MDTVYGNAKCGKKVSGYGYDNLEKNTKAHEEICPDCKGTVITETVKSSNPKIISDKPKFKEMDFNKDGKVDKDDRTLAAKLLGSKKGKKK